MFRALLPLLLAVPVAAGAPGTAAESREGSSEAGPAPRSPLLGDLDWLLLASGSEQGWHAPCGCAAVRAGGIARRAGLDARLEEIDPARPRTWVLAGNHSAVGEGEPGRERTRAILDWAASQEAAAVNLGGRELEAGLAWSLRALAERGLPAVSSSLVPASAGGPPLLESPIALKQVPEGPLVAFVGLLAHRPGELFEGSEGEYVTREPEAALAAGLAAARRAGADQVIVLADLASGRLEELARAVEGQALFFLGSSGQGPEQGEGWATLGSRGRSVLEVGFGADGPVLRYHVLDQRAPESAQWLERQLAASLAVNELRRSAARARLAEPRPPGSAYAGSGACRACHVAEYLTWERHGHSRALDGLRAVSAEFDPDCLACHATGFGRAGGFRSLLETPELSDVGCEACHGAGASHSATAGREPLVEGTALACAVCHDEANSPGFEEGPAWRSLAHGRSAP